VLFSKNPTFRLSHVGVKESDAIIGVALQLNLSLIGRWTLWTTFATLPSLANATTLATLTTLTSWAALTTGTLRAIFITRDFSIFVFIEFFQGLTRLRDFIRVDRAVMIQVEYFDNRIRHHHALTTRSATFSALAALAALTGFAGPAWSPGRTLTFGTLIAFLRGEPQSGCT
jgi:hypothetical protein